MKFSRNQKTKTSGIYFIYNKINNKVYIGSAKNLYERFHQHRNKLRKNVHPNSYLQNAYNKYGEENFIFYVHRFCHLETRFKLEQFYIDLYKPEYNLDLIVNPVVQSESKKKKISETLKRKYKSGEIINPSFREVKVFDIKGNHLYDFRTIQECSKKLCIGVSSIRRCLNKIHKQVKSYQIRFKEDENPGEILVDKFGKTLRRNARLKLG